MASASRAALCLALALAVLATAQAATTCTLDTDCGASDECICMNGAAPRVSSSYTNAKKSGKSAASPMARTPAASALALATTVFAACVTSTFGATSRELEALKVANCPWTRNTGEVNIVECEDGYRCDVTEENWACCLQGGHGQRSRCPVNHPFMCMEPSCGGGDFCCESFKKCQEFGGLRDTGSCAPAPPPTCTCQRRADWVDSTTTPNLSLVVPVTSCTASTTHSRDFGCEHVSDGLPSTMWATDAEGVDSWIRLNFATAETIDKMSYANKNGPERNKQVELFFEDASTQTVTLLDDGELNQFPLVAVTTTYVLITVKSVYSTVNNGAKQITFHRPTAAATRGGADAAATTVAANASDASAAAAAQPQAGAGAGAGAGDPASTAAPYLREGECVTHDDCCHSYAFCSRGRGASSSVGFKVCVETGDVVGKTKRQGCDAEASVTGAPKVKGECNDTSDCCDLLAFCVRGKGDPAGTPKKCHIGDNVIGPTKAETNCPGHRRS